MPFFMKKPVVIEAHRLLVDNVAEIAIWCAGRSVDTDTEWPSIAIETPEGVMKAVPGDWVVRGIQGEHYPVKPDIFEQTYEQVRLA